MIRVELVKLLRRPRTWITILLLNALPTLVAVLLAVTDIGPQPGEGPAFLSAVLTDGTLFPLAALAIVLPLFMPVAVAVVAGDAVAGRGAAAARCATCSPGRSVAPGCWWPSWSACSRSCCSPWSWSRPSGTSSAGCCSAAATRPAWSPASRAAA